MIPAANNGVRVEGNMTGEQYVAGIDDENMPHIIKMFTDLYSDRQMAFIREYSTNARDAQVEAGVERPIEVTLPNALSPFFRVKDYGVGLGQEDIKTIYSRYGSSTKRNTNAMNGMLGIGCKSALTYTHQFTVESVKDGKRTIASVSRDGRKVPVFTVLDVTDDDGPNGTEVIVPVQREHHQEVERKARKFFSYWPEGSVLLNDEQPDRVTGLDLGDGILLVKSDGYDRKSDLVVMGGVAYPVKKDELDLGLPAQYHAVINVPIGAVTFTPSRESLDYDDNTRGTLRGVDKRVQKAIRKAVQKEVDTATSAQAAMRVVLKHQDLLVRGGAVNLSEFSFKGRQMPEKVEGRFILAPWYSGKLSQNEEAPNGIPASYVARGLFVHGYDLATFTATHKRKLVKVAEDMGLTGHRYNTPGDIAYFALSAAKPTSTWIDQDRVVAWEDVKAVKLDPATRWSLSGRPTGSYDAYIGGKSLHIQAEDIDQDENIYYCKGMNKWEASDHAELIGKHDPNATVVCLPLNRVDKFLRNFPEAKQYHVGLRAAYDEWLATLTDDQRTALTIHDESDWGTFDYINPALVKDPEVVEACRVRRAVQIAPLLQGRREFDHVMHAIRAEGGEKGSTTDETWTDPLDKYPLVAHIRRGYYCREAFNEDHFYLYLNAAFETIQNAGNNGSAPRLAAVN